MSEGALSSILVVALEQAVAAPFCTVRLADGGARVIKVERPGGETARHYDGAVKGTSAYFAWLNRGKESAELDLKSPADFAVFEAMLERADVFVQNLLPGAIDRMGLTPDALARRFPRLITASITGYGHDTEYSEMRAYDMLVQAESGICAVTGTAETPVKVGVSIADIATGMNAHAAILEALIERSRTRRGKHIEIAMFDGMADWMAVPLLHLEQAGKFTHRHGLSHASIYPYRPYACRNGSIVISIQSDREWERLCTTALARADLLERKEFSSNTGRVANRTALDGELEPAFAAMTTAQAIERLNEAAIAWGRVSELTDVSRHPALRRIEAELPGGQTASMPRPAGRNQDFKTGPIPALGRDTAAIRAEFAHRTRA